MDHLKIYKDNYADMTAVSNIFIDEYMKDANDAQLKVYLYLIRMMNANLPIGISDIAYKFNHTEKDVLRALKYWEMKRLLALEYDEERNLSGIHLLDLSRQAGSPAEMPTAAVITPMIPTVPAITPMAPAAAPMAPVAAPVIAPMAPAAAPTIAPMAPAAAPVIAPMAPVVPLKPKPAPEETDPYAKPAYTLDQLKAFKAQETTSQLLFIVEQYVGKTLTPSEIRTVFFLSDKLSFSVDLIDYLVQYCLERGKKDFRYIEKVAVSWAQEGITTPEQAEKHAYKYEKIVYDVMKALGKNNAPTAKEVEYIRHWTKVLGYGMDIISAACERTVLSTDKHRFEYADSILNSWHNADIRHYEDIAKADENFRRAKVPQPRVGVSNKFNQFKQNNYDFDALEKELLRN